MNQSQNFTYINTAAAQKLQATLLLLVGQKLFTSEELSTLSQSPVASLPMLGTFFDHMVDDARFFDASGAIVTGNVHKCTLPGNDAGLA